LWCSQTFNKSCEYLHPLYKRLELRYIIERAVNYEKYSLPFVYIEITDFEYDPPGDDVLGEYLVIENQGTANQNMTGWKLKNDENETFRFPAYILKAGAGVTVWTKEGVNTETDLYWGSETPIWSNHGDCATLLDRSHQLVDWECY